MSRITLYKTPICPFCSRAKALLIKKGLEKEIKEIDITTDPNLMSEMLEKTGGKRTVPQIFVDDKYLGNCDDIYEYERRGQLDMLLGITDKSSILLGQITKKFIRYA